MTSLFSAAISLPAYSWLVLWQHCVVTMAEGIGTAHHGFHQLTSVAPAAPPAPAAPRKPPQITLVVVTTRGPATAAPPPGSCGPGWGCQVFAAGRRSGEGPSWRSPGDGDYDRTSTWPSPWCYRIVDRSGRGTYRQHRHRRATVLLPVALSIWYAVRRTEDRRAG